MPAERMAEMDERLEQLEAAVVRLEQTVSRGFSELTKRMDGFGARMDGFDARMDRFAARMDDFDARMDGFDARMDRFDLRLEDMNTRIDVTAESLRGDMARIVELLDGVTAHWDRTIANMRKEPDADRRLMYSTLKDHRSSLATLEDIVGSRSRRPESYASDRITGDGCRDAFIPDRGTGHLRHRPGRGPLSRTGVGGVHR